MGKQEQVMRTQDEIVTQYQESTDLFGFEGDVLIQYLDVEHLRPLCKPGADLTEIKPLPLTREQILQDMAQYMIFAWDKVRNHRGLSAGRSVAKMKAWLWLLGDDQLFAFASDPENYAQYGAPILKKISDTYGAGLTTPQNDRLLRMAQGLPCHEGCDEGCGQ